METWIFFHRKDDKLLVMKKKSWFTSWCTKIPSPVTSPGFGRGHLSPMPSWSFAWRVTQHDSGRNLQGGSIQLGSVEDYRMYYPPRRFQWGRVGGSSSAGWQFSNDDKWGYNHPRWCLFLVWGNFREHNAINKNLGLNFNCPDGLRNGRKLEKDHIPLGTSNSHLNHLAIAEHGWVVVWKS